MKLIIYKISASHIILETIKNKICSEEFNIPSSFVKMKNSYYIVQPYDRRCFDLGWNIIKKQTDCRPRVIFVEKEDVLVLEKITREFDTVDNHQYFTYSSNEFLKYIEGFAKDIEGVDGLDIYYSYLNEYFL